MNRSKLAGVVSALLCLVASACGKAGTPPKSDGAQTSNEQIASSSSPQTPGTAAGVGDMDQIVTPENLGANLKYVEALIGGPAMRTMKDDLGIERNFYKRGECYIQVNVKEARVVSVGASNLDAEGCDVDVGFLLSQGSHVMASKTKYADYVVRGPLHFTDGQVPSCNACGEGLSPYALIDGYSAIGNFDVRLSGDGDMDAGEKWRDLIRNSGVLDHNLPQTKENCPLRAFDAQGFEFLKHTKVTGIVFGIPGNVQPVCSGEAIWDEIRRSF